MSTLLLCVEAIGTRITSYSCPRGTPGRIHALRLRSRFQHASRPYANALEFASIRDWNCGHGESTHGISDPDLQRQQQQQSNEAQLPDTRQAESYLSLQVATTDSSSPTTSRDRLSRLRVSRGRWLGPSLARASRRDTAGQLPLQSATADSSSLTTSQERAYRLRIHGGSRLELNLARASRRDTAGQRPLQSATTNSSSLTTSHERPSRFHIRRVGQLPPYLARASRGDTDGLLPLQSQDNHAHHGYGNMLRRALQSDSPHAILNALTRLLTVSENIAGGYDTFRMLSPNTFSEILRCLDPNHFLGRYLNLHKNNVNLTSRSFTALRQQTEQGMYQFCIDFMARIRLIIAARHSNGSRLSLSDYKYLLRCAGATENSRASQNVWRAMKNDGFEPDTECYNYYLSGILKVSMSNITQRSELRTSYLPRVGPQEPSEVFRSYYDLLGIDFKYETTAILDDMLRRGVTGDERTFCLLMISSARVGDIEGVKSILGRVWDINVDTLMTMNGENITRPKLYHGGKSSPLFPSATLLFALTHCFGINNMIPTALRLVDHVSRMYSLTIPIEVWEDLLGMTYALSIPSARDAETMKRRPKGLYLQKGAVSSLWSVLTAEPFKAKPNMRMYDNLIMSLLRRERFGEARKQIAEARKLYTGKMDKYKETIAVEDLQSSLFEGEGDDERLESIRGTTAYENYLGLQRDKDFEHLALRHSRQYISRWCRVLIKLASRSLLKDPMFTFSDLPRFIYEYRLFMPRRIVYPTGTGCISFGSNSAQMSRAIALERRSRPWSLHNATLTRGATSSEQGLTTDRDQDEANHDHFFVSIFELDSDLDSQESFGRS